MIIRDLAEGGFVWVNKPFQLRLGWSADDLIDTPLAEWIDPEDRTLFDAAVDAACGEVRARHLGRKRNPLSLDWEIRKDGSGLVALGIASEFTTQRTSVSISAGANDEQREGVPLLVEN